VKKKNENNGKELERLDSDVFRPFDPEDESWVVGGSRSITTVITYTPGAYDVLYDFDYGPGEIEGVS
jgi:hypothetical protein